MKRRQAEGEAGAVRKPARKKRKTEWGKRQTKGTGIGRERQRVERDRDGGGRTETDRQREQ